MCFYHDDYDWTASVVENTTAPATKPTKCDECSRLIPVGEPVRHIFMQQHEICRHDPEHDDYVEGDAPACSDECEHDFGETSEYDRCEACDQLIEAIHQHELDQGCREYESRPNLTELYEAMSEDEGPAYLAKAESLYPGITARLPDTYLRHCEVNE